MNEKLMEREYLLMEAQSSFSYGLEVVEELFTLVCKQVEDSLEAEGATKNTSNVVLTLALKKPVAPLQQLNSSPSSISSSSSPLTSASLHSETEGGITHPNANRIDSFDRKVTNNIDSWSSSQFQLALQMEDSIWVSKSTILSNPKKKEL